MPQRLIRDGLLESEAVLSLPVEARWLYVSILLSADDVGLFEATPFRLARRADVRREMADKLVSMLVDADLVRLYQVDGKRFGFVPKFGQRLQIKRTRCPLPPVALLAGDSDAINKINSLVANTTVENRDARKPTAAQPPEPEPEPEVEKKTESISKVVGVSRTRSTDAKGSRLPDGWQLPRAWGEWAMAEVGMSRDSVKAEADKFADYWRAAAGAKARKADWLATWRNWCRNSQTALKTPIKGLPESFRERDARIAAERVAEATGGLSVDRAALRKPLPFEAGYVADVIEGESNVRRIA